jgi:hypothetical protein
VTKTTTAIDRPRGIIRERRRPGSPQRTDDPEQESRVNWDGPFLANQTCYVAGVLIASAKGAVPVESLTAGDVVLTHSGDRSDVDPSG